MLLLVVLGTFIILFMLYYMNKHMFVFILFMLFVVFLFVRFWR
jgi:hypothetical protein